MSGKLTPSEVAASENQEEKGEDVSGLVLFRPSENWFGEYGFDWYRGKDDDYKERSITLNYFSENASLYISECYLRKKMGGKKGEKEGDKKLKKWKKETIKTEEAWKRDSLRDIADAQSEYDQAVEEFDSTKKEIEQIRGREMAKPIDKRDTALLASLKDRYYNAQVKLGGCDVMLKSEKEKYENGYDQYVLKKYQDEIVDRNEDDQLDLARVTKYNNPNAWKKGQDKDNSYSENSKKVLTDEVIEYCYTPVAVVKVVYTPCAYGIWRRNLICSDFWNGDGAARDYEEYFNTPTESRPSSPEERGDLDAFIGIPGAERLSCFYEGSKIKIPIYCEDIEYKKDKENQSSDAASETPEEESGSQVISSKLYMEDASKKNPKCSRSNYFSVDKIIDECIKINDDGAKLFNTGNTTWWSIKMLCEGKRDVNYNMFLSAYMYFSDLEPLMHYKRIVFEKDNKHYALTYRQVHKKQYLHANVDGYEALYIDGDLKEVKLSYEKEVVEKGKHGERTVKKPVTEWLPLKSAIKLEGEAANRLEKLINAFSEGCLDDEWLNNKDKHIDKLSKDDSLKGLEITIMNPQRLAFAEANIEEEQSVRSIIRKKYFIPDPNNRNVKYEVVKWDDDYQRSFGFQHVRNKDKIGLYTYPVLSTTLWQEKEGSPDKKAADKRKKIEVRSAFDAPKIKDNAPDVKPNEYEIQLFYKDLDGNASKVRLESDCPMLELQENEGAKSGRMIFVNPEKCQTIRLKIGPCKNCRKYCPVFYGDSPTDRDRFYQPSITAHTLKDEEFKDDKEKEKKGLFAGKMLVRLQPAMTFPIYIVCINRKSMSSDYIQAMNDNFAGLNNSLIQAGLVPKIKQLASISVSGVVKHGVADIMNLNTQKRIMAALEAKLTPKKKGKKNKKEKQTDDKPQTLFDWLHKLTLIFLVDGDLNGGSSVNTVINYNGHNYNVVFMTRGVKNYRGNVSLLTHEMMHALGNPHSFMLTGHYPANKYCFPLGKTSNIMDYDIASYSLHQFQWDKMRTYAYPICKEYHMMNQENKK